jgi:hypothetical protein
MGVKNGEGKVGKGYKNGGGITEMRNGYRGGI